MVQSRRSNRSLHRPWGVVLVLLPGLYEGYIMGDSVVINEDCSEPPLVLTLSPEDGRWFDYLRTYAETTLGWGESDFKPARMCGHCKDNTATRYGCRVCQIFLCGLCLQLCSNCDKYICEPHTEHFASKPLPTLCRPCAERVWGSEYLEDTDEMYRLHNERVQPLKED